MKSKFVFILLIASCVIDSKAQFFQVDRIADTGSSSFLEGYRMFASNTGLMGVNHVWDLNKKLSLAQGVSYSNFFLKRFNHGKPQIISDYSFNAQIELRYYVIPREKNITSYVFCNYNILMYNGKDVRHNPNVNLGLSVQTYVAGSSSVSFRTSISTRPTAGH